ncbi:unnamed protein product [Moneuplotes crassus]|uniref:RING-type domain-containing protein n=1 Tax=Euplotes crassus TaxID=5936 RepID=A0AAD1XCX1_EUPCR|nr:unnamed protein product [Moneuplotes crassus]
MEKGQNNLKINVDPILDQFECLVCMNHFRTPHITKCGHSFCQDCIFECLNLKKQCPHCNEGCQPEEVIRNYQLEDLLNQLNEAKKAESEKYFDKIANNEDDEAGIVKDKSPIETVFLLNLREGLLKYQKYYQTLLDEKSKLIEDIDKKFAIKLMEEGEAFQATLESEKQQSITECEGKFREVIDMLVQNYSNAVGSAIPEPEALPVRVTVKVSNKNISFKEISMKSYDCMNDIKRIVIDRFKDMNDPVEEWGNDVQIYIRGPLVVRKREEDKNEWDIDEGMDPDKVLGKTMKVNNMLTTREKLGIQNGSTIEIYGTIKLKSDMPKKCMKVDFVKGQGEKYDYFKCNTCNLKWLCEACSECCHISQGHEIVPFLVDHTPDWACCYCVKKKKCFIRQ